MYHKLSFLSQIGFFTFFAIQDFEFSHYLIFLVLYQFKFFFLSFEAFYVFKLDFYFFCLVLSKFDFLIFFFTFLSFWGLSQFQFLSVVTIGVFEFCHQLSFWVLWLFFGHNLIRFFFTVWVSEFCIFLILDFYKNWSNFLSQLEFSSQNIFKNNSQKNLRENLFLHCWKGP